MHAQLCLQGSGAAAYLLAMHARCCYHLSHAWHTLSQAYRRGARPACAMQSWPQKMSCRAAGSLSGSWDIRYSSKSSSLGQLQRMQWMMVGLVAGQELDGAVRLRHAMGAAVKQ
jgi:hypothetical protein